LDWHRDGRKISFESFIEETMKFDNVIVVVRSAGERTIEPCHQLLLEIFPKSDIVVISEVPFSKAVEKSLEIGVGSGKEWLACIDADVLISKVETVKFLNYTQTANPNLFCVQSLILDKFFSIIRPSGIHMYRTKLCTKAIGLIPKEGLTLRPESFLKQEMALLGHPTQQSNIVVGIHDFEQYYADIFRKCFLQSHKHSNFMKDVTEFWRIKKKLDLDFQVALYGAMAGAIHQGEVLIDKRFLEKEAVDVLDLKGITEKIQSPLISTEQIDEILNNKDFINHSLQQKMFPNIRWNELLDQKRFQKRKIKKGNEANKYNLFKRTGNLFVKLGKAIYKLGS